MEGTLALIVPVSGAGVPSHPIAPGGGHPSHPWVPPSGEPSNPIALPPPGIWPAPPGPDQGLPATPPGGHIDNSLPIVPGVPIYPDAGLPEGPGGPSTQPLPPGVVWPPLPPQFTGKVIALVIVFGVGYRWAVLDLDLKPQPK